MTPSVQHKRDHQRDKPHPSFLLFLLPHLSAQIKWWDPPVWINGCISSRETCQYLPRPPRTGLINEKKKRANLSTYLCPGGIVTSPRFNPVSTPVIPRLLFLTSSQLISPSLWQIITLLRLVMLQQMHEITDGGRLKKSTTKKANANRVLLCLMNAQLFPCLDLAGALQTSALSF